MSLTLDQQRAALASWMPPGMAWAAFRIANTNCFNFLLGLAPEFVTMAAFISAGRLTIPDPSNNTDFLVEWEVAVAIPDDCFPGTGTTAERWTHVLAKFASMNVQSGPDFEALAAIFGFVVTVEGGIGSVLFPASFSSDKEARNTIVVTFTDAQVGVFPYTFPFTFEESQSLIIECVFRKLKPATNDIRFIFPPS